MLFKFRITQAAICLWLIAIVVNPLVGSAQLADETANRLITIAVPDEQIKLASDELILPFAVPDRSEWPTHGVFTIHATAFLPSWGVSIAAESLQGTSSILPPERIWVETAETHGNFVQLGQQVPVIIGNDYSPTLESEISLSVRPNWLDTAGPYSGKLVFNPYIPGTSSSSVSTAATGDPLDRGHEVSISFDIPEVIELSVSQVTLQIDAVSGPGTYVAHGMVGLTVSTNARQWQVICDALPFRHTKVEDWIIPLDRVRWRLDCIEPPDGGSWETFSDSSIIVRDEGPVSGYHLCISFAVDVISSDHAGTYMSEVTLRGEVIQ